MKEGIGLPEWMTGRPWLALLAACAFVAAGAVLVLGSRSMAPAAAPPPPNAAQRPEPRPQDGAAPEAAGARAASAPPARAPARAGSSRPGAAERASASAAAASDGRGFDCIISASEQAEIGSAVRGTLRDVYVERGDAVHSGQLLAALDWSTERAALELAQARVERTSERRVSEEQARLRDRQRQRAVELHERHSLSLEMRELAESEARLAALERGRVQEDEHQALLVLEQARVALQRRMIVSPISGVVVERMRSRGELVDAEPILRVARIDRLRVEVILPSSLFGKLRPGDPAEITPEAPYDRPQTAPIDIVDPILDGASGTFGVRLALPNPDLRLPGGLRCQARFPTAQP